MGAGLVAFVAYISRIPMVDPGGGDNADASSEPAETAAASMTTSAKHDGASCDRLPSVLNSRWDCGENLSDALSVPSGTECTFSGNTLTLSLLSCVCRVEINQS